MTSHKSRGQTIRSTWFNLGASAVTNIWPDAPLCYVCPLCARGYLPSALQSGELTLEHAPPRRLRGREVALTCRTCNNLAGHTLDNNVSVREDQLDFVMGTMERPISARFEIDGDVLNADILRGENGLSIAPLANKNNPEVYHRVTRRVSESGSGDNFRLTLVKGYHPRLAFFGLLRAAYLVAFAALGYRYAFGPQMLLVRQQLANPEQMTLRVFSATVSSADKDQRLILFVEEPSWLKSLAIQMGRHLVFLPPITGGETLYQCLEAENEKGNQFHATVSGKTLGWPKRPLHTLDFLVP